MKKEWKILAIFIFHSFFVAAQNKILETPISINLRNVAVYQALAKITEKTAYYFTYDGATLDANNIVSINCKNVDLKTCLDKIFDDDKLVYKVIGNHIVINKRFGLADEIAADTAIQFIEIKAKVVDQVNNKPLAFAAISIMGYGIGTITNEDGDFVLKIPKALIHENLCVSYIAYANNCIPVIKLYGKAQNIQLRRNYVSVQEVIIRSVDPKVIIRQVNENIKKNYSTKPNYLTTFYREWVKNKGGVKFFSEAVLKVYKSAYTASYEIDQVKMLKARNYRNVSERDTVQLKLKSGLHDALLLDIVKNSIDFLDEDNFHYYDYQMVDIIKYNDHPAYVIEFKQKKNIQDALYIGQIYVDMDDLAIIGAEFSINQAKIAKANSRFVVKKERGLKIFVKQAKYRISYHKVNGKYYLRHVIGELKMKVKKKKKLFATSFHTSLEMAVIEIDTVDVHRFKRKETLRLNTIFTDNAHDYDEDFWENYNFIKPEDSWQEAISKLQLKLGKQQESLKR